MANEPARGLPRIAYKLRTQGIGWIAKRMSSERLQPTTLLGRAIHDFARRSVSFFYFMPRWFGQRYGNRSAEAQETLYAFYDLKVAPITFDFLWFLASANLQRRSLGLERVHIVIVPGPHLGVRREQDDYEAVVDPEARRERVRNILMQCCSLLPSCAGVTQAASREEAGFLRSFAARHVYPDNYEPALPVYPGPGACLAAGRAGDRAIAALRATPERLRDAECWIAAHAGGRRVVTITMRNYDYMPIRNSHVAAWAEFARSLDPSKYFPVFIPDTGETLRGTPTKIRDFAAFPEAAWHVGLRMALYERAYFNIGVNTGPMGLCWLNSSTRYATLKMSPPGVPQTSLDYFRQLGFEPGQSLPFARPGQILVWDDDTIDVIKSSFQRAIAEMEHAENTSP